MPTLTDIMNELDKPGRDPREQLEEFAFDERVHTIDDLQVGMVLLGIVTQSYQPICSCCPSYSIRMSCIFSA